ncbi:MAG: ABC transporter substrate-binding protein [Bryobacteraceae bacterium]
MRIWLASIAAVSLLCAPAEAARRPRYGGNLRVAMRAVVDNADPAAWPSDSLASAAKQQITAQVFETLVRIDAKGRPQPWLAKEWSYDAPRRRWLFTAREGVRFHDGSLWQPDNGVITVPADRPIAEILALLAHPRSAIAQRGSDGALLGTGPFRIGKWDAKAVTLAAHEAHWQGRPFLDTIEITMGASLREQTLALELGRADIVELAANEVRASRQRNARLSTTQPIETIALILSKDKAHLRERLSLAIDRQSIHQVILQRQGEITAALLPQWLSGYAFLFSTLFQPLPPSPPIALTIAHDPQDALLRAIADRVALNTTQAGLPMRPATNQQKPDVRLLRLCTQGRESLQALRGLSAELGIAMPEASPYETEKSLIETAGVIPLLHLPVTWRLSERVRNWAGTWRLENVWVEDKP